MACSVCGRAGHNRLSHATRRNPKTTKAPKKKPSTSKPEAQRIAKEYYQTTLTETGNAKKDYHPVRLFNPKRRRAKGR